MGFNDQFSKQAASYAKFRPGYPGALYSYLASLVEARDLAWDCATGNGQAARSLVPYFRKIVATDASEAQIRQAPPQEPIVFSVAAAESCPVLTGSSVDLVTSANGAHWFDLDAFYREVRRVLKPSGVVAIWCYNESTTQNPLDQIIRDYLGIVGSYFPSEVKRYVWDDYKSIPFPFREERPPVFSMSVDWTLGEIIGYIDTWSATQRYREATGLNPLASLETRLRELIQVPGQTLTRSWQVHLRVGRP